MTRQKHLDIFRIVFSAAFLAALATFTALPAHAQTSVVTKIADSADGMCDASDCSLREAIISANAAAGANNDAGVLNNGTQPAANSTFSGNAVSNKHFSASTLSPGLAQLDFFLTRGTDQLILDIQRSNLS